MSSVIDRNAFNKIKSYIDYVKQSSDAKIIAGGTCKFMSIDELELETILHVIFF
jgi:acyl-CoA reductase-like NAD-dependent aldehyde dehydrogenase